MAPVVKHIKVYIQKPTNDLIRPQEKLNGSRVGLECNIVALVFLL